MVEGVDADRLKRVGQVNRLQGPALGERMVADAAEAGTERHAFEVDAVAEHSRERLVVGLAVARVPVAAADSNQSVAEHDALQRRAARKRAGDGVVVRGVNGGHGVRNRQRLQRSAVRKRATVHGLHAFGEGQTCNRQALKRIGGYRRNIALCASCIVSDRRRDCQRS